MKRLLQMFAVYLVISTIAVIAGIEPDPLGEK
jgi:hypothetical protein